MDMNALHCGCRHDMCYRNSAEMYAIIGILFLTKCVNSLNLNCTRLTTACPTAAQWSDRGKSFNCSGHKSYVCLMASNAELREGCIFDVMILAGHTGCPCTKQCDDWTGQPLLVTEKNYLRCPPDLNGCPPRNHSGYSILKIYNYPRCQGKNISDERSVSSVEVTSAETTTPLAGIPRYVNWTLNTICITIGIILALVTIVGVVFHKKKEGRLKKMDLEVDVVNNRGIPLENMVINPIRENDVNSKPIQCISSVERINNTIDTIPSSITITVSTPQYCILGTKSVPRSSADQQSYATAQQLQNAPFALTTETEQRDLNIESDKQLVNKKSGTMLSRHSSCSSRDSDGSQGPMLKWSHNGRCQPVNEQNYITSSQTGHHKPYPYISVRDSIPEIGNMQENFENTHELQRRDTMDDVNLQLRKICTIM